MDATVAATIAASPPWRDSPQLFGSFSPPTRRDRSPSSTVNSVPTPAAGQSSFASRQSALRPGGRFVSARRFARSCRRAARLSEVRVCSFTCFRRVFRGSPRRRSCARKISERSYRVVVVGCVARQNIMLVMENGYHRRGPSSTASPSILDSPTLARVERARLRHEQEEQNGTNSPLQYTLSSYCPVNL